MFKPSVKDVSLYEKVIFAVFICVLILWIRQVSFVQNPFGIFVWGGHVIDNILLLYILAKRG